MSEALRLARELDACPTINYKPHAAELRRLHAEVDRLTKCITYEQHRAERIGTHGPGCHTWGPQHYECAKRLNAELVEALREIEWSNDTAWQRDRARAALAKAQGESK